MSTANRDFVSLLFSQHGQDLLGYLGSRLQSHEIEDVAQKAYLKLLQHPDPATIENPKAYLFKMASNLAIDHVRSRKLETDRLHSGMDGESQMSPEPGPDTAVDSGRRLDCFRDALASLPSTTRVVFLLNRVDGMTHAKIAARLRISEKTVERHIVKALERCNRRLSRLGDRPEG